MYPLGVKVIISKQFPIGSGCCENILQTMAQEFDIQVRFCDDLCDRASQAIDVIMRGQSIGANTQALHLIGKEDLLRLDPKVPDGLFALDRMKEEELLSKAAHESRPIAPLFKQGFTRHIAEKFKPFHLV